MANQPNQYGHDDSEQSLAWNNPGMRLRVFSADKDLGDLARSRLNPLNDENYLDTSNAFAKAHVVPVLRKLDAWKSLSKFHWRDKVHIIVRPSSANPGSVYVGVLFPTNKIAAATEWADQMRDEIAAKASDKEGVFTFDGDEIAVVSMGVKEGEFAAEEDCPYPCEMILNLDYNFEAEVAKLTAVARKENPDLPAFADNETAELISQNALARKMLVALPGWSNFIRTFGTHSVFVKFKRVESAMSIRVDMGFTSDAARTAFAQAASFRSPTTH